MIELVELSSIHLEIDYILSNEMIEKYESTI